MTTMTGDRYPHCTRAGSCQGLHHQHAPGCLSLTLTDAEYQSGLIPPEHELRARAAIMNGNPDPEEFGRRVQACRDAATDAEFGRACEWVDLVDPECLRWVARERALLSTLRWLRSRSAMLVEYGPGRVARIERASAELAELVARIDAAVAVHRAGVVGA